MKRFLMAATLAAASIPAFAADVGVSVSIGQPGFYGTIDIGNYPRPQVVYEKPVIIAPVRPGVIVEPLYLRVPPGHVRKWGKHCREYNACGRPVYFVRDDWYERTYVPAYRERHGHGDDDDQGRDHDRYDHDRDHGDHGGHGRHKGRD